MNGKIYINLMKTHKINQIIIQSVLYLKDHDIRKIRYKGINLTVPAGPMGL